MNTRIDVYASLAPDVLYEKGKNAGLSDDAANYFRYFEEVHLSLEVDQTTGKVVGATIAQKFSS